MATKTGRFDAQRASIGWARFGRDVLASVLATGLATIAFSHAPREARDEQPPARIDKVQDRLVWQVEDVPVRLTRTFDSLAMFGLAQVEPSPWSAPSPTAAVGVARPVRIVAAAGGEVVRHPLAAILPPNRPVRPVAGGRGRDAAEGPTETMAAAPSVRREPARLLGWEPPALGFLPARNEMLQRVASFGDAVAGAGDAIADGLGLR